VKEEQSAYLGTEGGQTFLLIPYQRLPP